MNVASVLGGASSDLSLEVISHGFVPLLLLTHRQSGQRLGEGGGDNGGGWCLLPPFRRLVGTSSLRKPLIKHRFEWTVIVEVLRLRHCPMRVCGVT